MSLTNSNTYVEPTAGTSLNTARSYYNDSLRSILTNFISPSRPSAVNLTADGAPLGEIDGMLYRSTTNKALYISDSVNKKSSPVGGNFTRVGIGHRIEESNTTLNTNRTTYEIGELVATLNDSRLYVRTSNTDSLSSFVDVGAPRGYTTGALDNATFSGQSVSAIRFLATSNVAVNTVSPAYRLDVIGDARISTNATIGSLLFHQNDVGTYIGYPVSTTNTVVVATASSEKLRIDALGNVGIGTTAAKAKLQVTGNASISSNLTVGSFVSLGTANILSTLGISGAANAFSTVTITGNTYVYSNVIVSGDISSSSDYRLKENIVTVSNALNKVLALEGVYYNRVGDESRKLGVIAQQVADHIPEVITSDGEYLSVAYGNIIGVLIEAIKELKQEIDGMKKVENSYED